MAGFTVSGLTDYTNKATELLRGGVLFSDAINQFNIQSGIKYKEPLNIITATPVLQAGACSLTASGATALTERVITVATFSYRDSYCIQDLQKKNLSLVAGSKNDAFASDFEDVLTQELVNKMKNQTEKTLWLGDIGSGSLIDGIVNVLADEDLYITAATTTIAANNVISLFQGMVALITEEMWSRGPLTIYTSVANYNIYKNAMIAGKYAYQSVANIGAMEADFEGYAGQISVKAEPGLNGSNATILTWAGNIYVGTDEVSEVSAAQYVFDPVTKLVWFQADFKLGVQVAFPGEVVANF